MVILGFYMFIRSRRKLVFGGLIAVVAIAVIVLAAKSWDARFPRSINTTRKVPP